MAVARFDWDSEVGGFPEWIHNPSDRSRWRELTIEDGWYVYSMFGSESTPLYIGMTGNLYRRLTQHCRSKAWWPQVTHIIVGLAESRRDAYAWERRYISRAMPVHNIDGKC